MIKISISVTVYYEEPFCTGLFERIVDGKLSVCKVVFGAEPKEYELKEYILVRYYRLNYSPSIKVITKEKNINPKRRQRIARKQTQEMGIGTKSQQALQQQREQMKVERKKISKDQKEEKQQQLYELKKQKRKEKHKRG